MDDDGYVYVCDTGHGKIEKFEEFGHAGGIRTLISPSYREDIALRIMALQ